MSIPIKIPSVGESITEVVLSKWYVEEGSYAELDAPICEIESEKTSFEITAEVAGVISRKVGAGETLKIGQLVCEIEPSQKPPASTKMPDKKAVAAEEDAPAGSPSSQATPPSEGSNAVDSSSPVPTSSSGPSLLPVEGEASTKIAGHPSPAAAKALRESGKPDKGLSPGSGKGGRVTLADVKSPALVSAAGEEPAAQESSGKKSGDTLPPSQKESPASVEKPLQGRQRVEKMSPLRRTIAKRLVEVRNTTAMLTTFNEVDLTEVIRIRKDYKEMFKERFEVGLGFMSFFTKASCVALRQFPAINAFVEGENIVYNEDCHVSIAVSTDRGLVVPIIRNADQLDFQALEKEIVNLAKKAREEKLTMSDMKGGTFTITNGGVFGSLLSTPILNSPQSGILGMHNIQKRPVVVDNQIVIRDMMYLALSYDHRIVDGKESVSFLVFLKNLLEDPVRLLLGL